MTMDAMSMDDAHALSRPPLRRDGARSPLAPARIDFRPNVAAMFLCHSSDRGLHENTI
jgi:hypothetical protein